MENEQKFSEELNNLIEKYNRVNKQDITDMLCAKFGILCFKLHDNPTFCIQYMIRCVYENIDDYNTINL